jgi:GPH family glycoside/pentoside/hexuronide:cation symporter
MTETEKREAYKYSAKKAVAYSFGQISLITAYQAFTFLVFTFYFSVVGLNVNLITVGFLIWSIWNAFNDPLMGYISDKTHTKWGRRRPYIMFMLLPLAIVMFLLFVPPLSFGILSSNSNFIYFVIIIIAFEFCYTTYDINLTSMLPEIFMTEEARIKANNIRQVFAIFGLIFAFILPSFFIADYSDPNSLPEYHIFGYIITIIIMIVGIIFLLFTPRERKEFQKDHMDVPGFFTSFKICMKNKSFRWAIPAFIGDFFVDTILPTIVPLYGKFVLGIGEGETLFLSLLLGATFLSAAIFITVLWKPVAKKIGIRKMWMISSAVWIATLAPLMFINDKWSGLIVFFLVGIGLAGSLYSKDLIVSDIIDEDEVNTGTRRDASYFGIYIFFLRLGNIFVFFSIGLVFTNVGWATFDPTGTVDVIFGLRILGFVFPAIALLIIILAMYKYPLHGDYLKGIKRKSEELHEVKRKKLED